MAYILATIGFQGIIIMNAGIFHLTYLLSENQVIHAIELDLVYPYKLHHGLVTASALDNLDHNCLGSSPPQEVTSPAS